jgi:hypothetical protein
MANLANVESGVSAAEHERSTNDNAAWGWYVAWFGASTKIPNE